jgi:hypothetical protein
LEAEYMKGVEEFKKQSMPEPIPTRRRKVNLEPVAIVEEMPEETGKIIELEDKLEKRVKRAKGIVFLS